MSSAISRPRRGRPAQLSRQQILDAALELLAKHPAEQLTMTGLAKAMGVPTMSLYTHVRNRDDLLAGIADLVLEQFPEVTPSADWRAQTRAWMYAFLDILSRYPQGVKLLSEQRQPTAPWLRAHLPLVRCLYQAGLRGRELANASRWLAHSVIGMVMLNNSRGDDAGNASEAAVIKDLMHDFSAEDQLTLNALLTGLAVEDDLISFTLDSIIDALALRIDATLPDQE